MKLLATSRKPLKLMFKFKSGIELLSVLNKLDHKKCKTCSSTKSKRRKNPCLSKVVNLINLSPVVTCLDLKCFANEVNGINASVLQRNKVKKC